MHTHTHKTVAEGTEVWEPLPMALYKPKWKRMAKTRASPFIVYTGIWWSGSLCGFVLGRCASTHTHTISCWAPWVCLCMLLALLKQANVEIWFTRVLVRNFFFFFFNRLRLGTMVTWCFCQVHSCSHIEWPSLIVCALSEVCAAAAASSSPKDTRTSNQHCTGEQSVLVVHSTTVARVRVKSEIVAPICGQDCY